MIHEILMQGAENAQTGREICNLLNISMRDLNAEIEQERREGQPICAGSGEKPGYYLAGDRETMETFCRRLEHRQKEIAKTCRACRGTARKLPEREAVPNGEKGSGSK